MGLNFPPNTKNPDLIKLVFEFENYDEDFVKGRLKLIITEGIEIVHREYELKKLELHKKSKISKLPKHAREDTKEHFT